MAKSVVSQIITSKSDLIFPPEVEEDYDIPIPTQEVWRCTNRYGWRDITIKLGRRVAYRRSDIELWLDSRRGLVQEDKHE